MLHGRLMRHHLAHQAQQAAKERVKLFWLDNRHQPACLHAYPLSTFFPVVLGVTPAAFSTRMDQALALKPVMCKQAGNDRSRRNSRCLRENGVALPAARLPVLPVSGCHMGRLLSLNVVAHSENRLRHVSRRLHIQHGPQLPRCSSMLHRLACR